MWKKCSLGEENIEIVNAITGKTLNGSISRLCKQQLFGKFYTLLNLNLPSRTNISVLTAPEVYIDAKNAATDYKVIFFFLFNNFNS